MLNFEFSNILLFYILIRTNETLDYIGEKKNYIFIKKVNKIQNIIVYDFADCSYIIGRGRSDSNLMYR